MKNNYLKPVYNIGFTAQPSRSGKGNNCRYQDLGRIQSQ